MTIKYVNFYSFGLLEYMSPSTYMRHIISKSVFIRNDNDAIGSDASFIISYSSIYYAIPTKLWKIFKKLINFHIQTI